MSLPASLTPVVTIPKTSQRKRILKDTAADTHAAAKKLKIYIQAQYVNPLPQKRLLQCIGNEGPNKEKIRPHTAAVMWTHWSVNQNQGTQDKDAAGTTRQCQWQCNKWRCSGRYLNRHVFPTEASPTGAGALLI